MGSIRQTRIIGVCHLLRLPVDRLEPLLHLPQLHLPPQLHLLVEVLVVYLRGSMITIAMMKTTILHVNLMVAIAAITLHQTGIGIALLANASLPDFGKHSKKTASMVKMMYHSIIFNFH